MNEDTPLIYTSKGNVPIDTLRYEHRWSETEDYVSFEEIWYDQSGELVKNSRHVLAKKPLIIGVEQVVV